MTPPLPIRDAAPLLGCSERKLRELIYRGQIGHYRIGGSIVFAERHLQAFLDSCEVGVRVEEPSRPRVARRALKWVNEQVKG